MPPFLSRRHVREEPIMGVTDHHAQAAQEGAVPLAIVTVSDTRTPETDVSGQTIRELATAAGHVVVDYRIVKDEPAEVRQVLSDFSAGPARIIIFNGGTGIGRRDRTYDVISQALEKTLPGFGEIFRLLSYQEIGPAAMLSRATAGVYGDTVIFSTPGSPNAVRLAMEKLILPEMQHLAWELIR
jgi:molybdenum cofactor biosynthesis protein B